MTELDMDRSAEHHALVHAIREELGRDDRLTMWINRVGKAKTTRGYRIEYGLIVGSSDLVAIIKPSGRWFALEAKTGNAVPTRDQRFFIELIRAHGGFACVVRSLDDAKQALERALLGATE